MHDRAWVNSRKLPLLNVSKRQLQLNIKELLFWDHGIYDALDLASGILGLMGLGVCSYDALVEIESFTQVFGFVMRRIRCCVLVACFDLS
jgi:hypothetical protein